MVTSNLQSFSFLRSRAEMYAEVIAEKSEALGNCIGFIDATVVGITRPGEDDMQREVYNGHKRKHALKYGEVTTPDGLIANFFGPVVGRRHACWMFAQSSLDEFLGTELSIGDKQYVIYGDSGYNHRSYLEVPFDGANLSPGQIQFNRAISGVRITVEWAFKEVKMYSTIVDFKRKLRLRESPISSLYVGAVLLANYRNCFYPNETSQFFKPLLRP